MDDLHIEYLPISAIKPYEKNARKHKDADVDAIVASIKEFGFDDPIGVWGDKNIIVEGHGRLMAAKKLGMESVPVIHLDHLTDEQRRAYALAHNKTAENSEWDDDLLFGELGDIFDIDMEQFGFGFVEAKKTVVEDDYEPVIPVEPKARGGQIYQLGRHRLMCGDSTCRADVERLCGGNLVDMLLTDPPYNVNIEETAGKIMNDNMPSAEFLEFLTKAFSCARNAMKPGAVFPHLVWRKRGVQLPWGVSVGWSAGASAIGLGEKPGDHWAAGLSASV